MGGTRRRGCCLPAQSFPSPCLSSFASSSSSRCFSTCLRASPPSSICSGRHKLRHRRRIRQEVRRGRDSPELGCLCQTYSGAPATLSSTSVKDSQLTGAQTYSGAQAILLSLAQLYIRLYMEKTTHYLKKT